MAGWQSVMLPRLDAETRHLVTVCEIGSECAKVRNERGPRGLILAMPKNEVKNPNRFVSVDSRTNRERNVQNGSIFPHILLFFVCLSNIPFCLDRGKMEMGRGASEGS